MSRAAAAVSLGAVPALGGSAARMAFLRCAVTLLGVAASRSGESRAWMAESKLRRRHGFGLGGWVRALLRAGSSGASSVLVRGWVPGQRACNFGGHAALLAPTFRGRHHGFT
jgi:hypothetical protein